MQRNIEGRVKWTLMVFAMVVACIAPPSGHATSSRMTAFNTRYGTAGTRLDSCSVCHDGSPPAVNFYGSDVLTEQSLGRTITTALANIEGIDSDGDGALNLAEIQARTFPGDALDKPAAGAPVMGVTPTTLPFGNVRQGSGAVLTATITNTGSAALSVTGLVTSGSVEFGLTNAPVLPLTVAAAGSAKVTVRYLPANTGPDSGTLTIKGNDSAHPSVAVALSGTGVAPALTVNPVALAFGALQQGRTTNLTLTLGNAGSANCLIGGLTKSGSADFAFGQDAPVAPFTITPGSSIIVPIAYTPSNVGADTGSVQVASDDLANPSVTVTLTGTGDPIPASSSITVNPASLTFGTVRVGQSNALNVVIGNAGGASCSVTALGISGSNFVLGAAAPFNVAPGAQIAVPVVYAPSSIGNGIGTLAVTSTDPNKPLINVGLSGVGALPQIGVTLATVDFGTAIIGGSVSRSVVVTNSGGAALSVTSLVLTASAEFDYGASAPFPPFIIEAGRATNIALVYAPANEGPDSGALAIGSDDPSAPNVTVALNAIGQVPAPVPHVQATPSALGFEDVRVGQAKAMKVIVSNSGGAIAHVGAPAVSGSSEFTTASSAFDIPVGGSTEVTVTYTPAGEGSDTGSLSLTSDDPVNPSISVALAGRGVQPALSVTPASVAFGQVVTNGIVTRIVTIANGGSADAAVSALTIAGSAEFALGATAPTVPFTVAAGASVDVPVSYRPADVGADAGTLDVSSDDPVKPHLTVALGGAGILTTQAVDLDIAQFKVSDRYEVGNSRSRSIQIQLVVLNRGSVNGSRMATVIGLQNGVEVYRSTVNAAPKPRGRAANLTFPSYVPSAAGQIDWTATIEDDDPDSDVATAITAVTAVVVDLDISEFKVSERYEVGNSSRPIQIQLKLASRDRTNATRPATVVGMQAGAEVYRATLAVRANGGKNGTLFPSYVPKAPGQIQWTATVLDDDPDLDVATATTSVTRKSSDDDDDDDDSDD